MQIRFSPSMKSINISTSSNGFLDLMKVKVAARHISYRTLFHSVLILAFLLPFVFILTAVVTLEGVNKCSSFDCLGRRLGPSFLGRGADDSVRLQRDLYTLLDQANSVEIPPGLRFPESFDEFLSEMKHNNYDANTFVVMVKGTMEYMNREVKKARLAEQLNKHFAAIGVPKGLHCLSLRLSDEYSSNAHARKQLPPPQFLPLLSDNSFYHFVVATDNILAASVVVNSAVRTSMKADKIVFHVITDKKTYPAMHSWFALHSISPATIEVKGVHQFNCLTKENVPVLEAIENHHHVRNHYHKNHVTGTDIDDNPRVFASKLQARSPKYISLLNHLRIYLPEMFPSLNKVVFLDDDIVAQHDLTELWNIDLYGKVNGAVETCKGEDKWVMSKRFRTYFNFSNPLIANNLDPDECAWAYGMNVFDLKTWRKTKIRETYHYWVKENLNSNLTLWKLGTLPPALIAFRGHVHPMDPSWHMLGLGYQEETNLDNVRKAAVIHYNGQCKPWLEIGYRLLKPFWTKHVNYSNEFIKNCHILEPAD
ncbi:probable galacturonosyltransferase 13 [Phalaenopsis equestris]|uniref:probable galacturonosyltransferase 13 n=1 Tax=Phalaenopsis equestris TaxID=78828 RepID=UPI0009E5F9AC|nr:probable galacturonosyltransferase 13 [Phalaenopsis equestris]